MENTENFINKALESFCCTQMDQIDCNKLYEFYKSDELQIVINNYLLTKQHSLRKRNAISFHVAACFDDRFGYIDSEIRYLSFDLDFLHFSLPFFSKYFPISEIYELHYLFKKIFISKYSKFQKIDSVRIRTAFYDEGTFEFNEEEIYLSEINSIDCNVLVDVEMCYELCKNKELMLVDFDYKGRIEKIQEIVSVLKFASKGVKNDLILFTKLIKQDYFYVKYIHSTIKKNKELFQLSIITWKNIQSGFYHNGIFDEIHPFIYFDLKDDKECVLMAINISWELLEYVSDDLRNDKQVLLAAVKKNGSSLQFASEKFKDDKDVALAAVSTNGLAIEYISKRLQEDKEIQLAAISEDASVFNFMSDILKSDKTFILESVGRNGNTLEYVSEIFKNDKDVVL